MKKQGIYILLLVTGLVAAFTIGFYVGRNTDRQTILYESLSPSAAVTTVPETTAAPQIQFPIDLNTATMEELTALPGIGEVLATRILKYREENGPFETIDALCNVSGIGEKRLEELKDYITLGGNAQ